MNEHSHGFWRILSIEQKETTVSTSKFYKVAKVWEKSGQNNTIFASQGIL